MAADELIGLLHDAEWRPEKGPDLIKVPRKKSTGLVFRTNRLMAFQKHIWGSYRSYYLGPEAPIDGTLAAWSGSSRVAKASDRAKAHELVQEFERYKILEFEKEDIEEIDLAVKGRTVPVYMMYLEIRSTKGKFRLDLASLELYTGNPFWLISTRCLAEFAREKTSVVPYKARKGYLKTAEWIEEGLDRWSDKMNQDQSGRRGS